MKLVLWRVAVILIVTLMLIPVLLYKDHEQFNLSQNSMEYSSCESIENRAVYFYCLKKKAEQRARGCSNFPEETLKASCFENVNQERLTYITLNPTHKGFSFSHYNKIFLFGLVLMILIMLLKPPFIYFNSYYAQMIKSFLGALPQSDYLAQRPWWLLVSVVFLVILIVISALELAARILS